MTDDLCQRYAEDPEANAAHLRECARCREIYGMLGQPVESQPLRVDSLPLAPWEGAAYRSWPLVFGGALTLLAIAVALCAAAGISPLRAVLTGMIDARLDTFIVGSADTLRRTSRIWQTAYGIGFVVVNTILILLLRRPPRGIDA
jgi:hypothetical protein